ncbi:hypothetical protein, partial [Neptunomonas phycophila]|uniref:hypothetical protein n=1 Tax=Neptunomonas phycophila TaxID=1572645 RepID=UPI003511DED7
SKKPVKLRKGFGHSLKNSVFCGHGSLQNSLIRMSTSGRARRLDSVFASPACPLRVLQHIVPS